MFVCELMNSYLCGNFINFRFISLVLLHFGKRKEKKKWRVFGPYRLSRGLQGQFWPHHCLAAEPSVHPCFLTDGVCTSSAYLVDAFTFPSQPPPVSHPCPAFQPKMPSIVVATHTFKFPCPNSWLLWKILGFLQDPFQMHIFIKLPFP